MPESFPERLKRVRELRGLSQAELAKKAGLQPTAISHFETGSRSPSFDNLRRLADALTVTTDFLMGRSPETNLAGPGADSLFRGLDKLSDGDIDALKMMKEALLSKKQGG
jgi:transcriptional regulator with XRE-family HTH domain